MAGKIEQSAQNINNSNMNDEDKKEAVWLLNVLAGQLGTFIDVEKRF